MTVKKQGWKDEIRTSLLKEDWALSGPKRPVKVIAFDRMLNPPLIRGYFTLAKFLFGRMPREIEQILGLKADTLKSGAFVYDFSRLPQISEYEYDLTARYPGGLALTPGNSEYPEGDDKVHQWQLKQGVAIAAGKVVRLKPDEKFTITG